MPEFLYLIDGDCTMCNRLIVWILSKRISDDIYFYPLQKPISKKFLIACGIEEKHIFSTSYLVAGNKVEVKSRAFFKITRKLKKPYSLLYYLIAFPSLLSDLAYDGVARVRFRLFGRQKETCELARENYSRFLLTDAQAEKFLEKVRYRNEELCQR